MRPRSRLALVLALGLASCLCACGGGQGDSTAAAPTATTTKPPAPLSAAELAATRKAAGAAAPFVVAEGDNSVPTFGAEASAGERTKAEVTLGAYLRAREAEDWAGACRYLAASVRRGIEKLAKGKATPCAPVLRALSKGADLGDPLTGRLLSLRVSGPHAFALFYGPRRGQYIVPMAREGSAWRPTQAAAIAYPPGSTPPTSP